MTKRLTVWVVRVGEDRYLHRRGNELLGKSDILKCLFRSQAEAQLAYECDEHDRAPGHYAVITETGNIKRGPKMKVVQMNSSFEEVK